MSTDNKDIQVVFTTEKIEEIRLKADQGYKIARHEKYWTESYILTKKDGIVFTFSEDETVEYMKCRLGVDINGNPYTYPETQTLKMSGIEYFAEMYCKVKNELGQVKNIRLRDYQKDILNMFIDNRFSIVMASRQVGKTINSAITILYYCIFERNKNILIAGNIAKTAEEILNKIKDIYYLLPFWLKPTVLVWNVSQITFGDTKCRIKTTATTRTAAIGNTIDLLYLDEFAHVDGGIAEDFYRSIYPTVSAIKNSKIIITSTPAGYNLFWKILNAAEKPLGDKDKNTFASRRVYWYQVPGRFVTYFRLNEHEINKNGLTLDDVYEWCKSFGFEEEILDSRGLLEKEGLKMVTNYETNKAEIHIPNKATYLPDNIRLELEGKEWENPLSDFFRIQYLIKEEKNNNGEIIQKKIKLLDLCDISSWKEDAIKDIGSIEAFNQEYDLQFLSGSKMVLDSNTMSKIENSIYPFEFVEIPLISEKSFIPYENLKWIKNRPDLFSNIYEVKKSYICMSVDISEGLNGDYSVINIFRLLPKAEDDWLLNITSLYDFFKLEQIGLYHCNTISVQDLGELLYLLSYEIFDDNKLGIVFESNNWGGELTKTMREMYQGRNKYSTHPFFRYKHRQDAIKPELGIKLRQNKNMFVKEYQKRIKQNDILIHHQGTLQEMTKFIKKESASGYTFQAEAGGNDDITMTIVELSTVFENNLFHDLINRFMSEIDPKLRLDIEKRLSLVPKIDGVDYTSLFNAKRNASMRANPAILSNNPYMNSGNKGLGNLSNTNPNKGLGGYGWGK